jgi:uncharacterized protein
MDKREAPRPSAPRQFVETRTYRGEQIEVVLRDAAPRSTAFPPNKYPDLEPGVTVDDGIVCERDVPVRMRDGITIYADIYRPEGARNLPVIVAWSVFGKRAGYQGQHVMGVPEGALSPGAKFEGPDPAYWCHHGYAVINPDSRGVGNSEGDIAFWGTGDGEDGYDLIEWVAAQEWCNGRVGMAGNSWLAIAQWYIAAQRPPHLTAIAPWEGQADWYRDGLFPGGIPEPGFAGTICKTVHGNNRIEDVPAMMKRYPLQNSFWADRRARVEDIDVPAYIATSYNPVHVHGTFDAYRRIGSRQKWLRVHNTQEWPDQYSPEGLEDLRRFFDRYLKGIRNGWEFTPRVRVSVLDPGGKDIVNRPEEDWPLPQTRYERLYLDGQSMTLSSTPLPRESAVRYQAGDGQGTAVFTYRFAKDAELVGYPKMHLWVEANGSDDIDLFVYLSKLDENGDELLAKVIDFPNPGARGTVRVSHREVDKTDPAASYDPFLLHRRELLLKPGEIVEVEFGIWPMGMRWHAGQQLRVVVQGFALPWMEDAAVAHGPMFIWETRNKGTHIIHTGGSHDSYLQIPSNPL